MTSYQPLSKFSGQKKGKFICLREYDELKGVISSLTTSSVIKAHQPQWHWRPPQGSGRCERSLVLPALEHCKGCTWQQQRPGHTLPSTQTGQRGKHSRHQWRSFCRMPFQEYVQAFEWWEREKTTMHCTDFGLHWPTPDEPAFVTPGARNIIQDIKHQ